MHRVSSLYIHWFIRRRKRGALGYKIIKNNAFVSPYNRGYVCKGNLKFSCSFPLFAMFGSNELFFFNVMFQNAISVNDMSVSVFI